MEDVALRGITQLFYGLASISLSSRIHGDGAVMILISTASHETEFTCFSCLCRPLLYDSILNLR
uniref:Uncharacterized protein n=1 Tax=Rhizophagus irregularis (strain DAOM 181602 / DAOM 197198 / MUCL 43194) TaxID=747089 RepID=U9TAW5_RHIID